MIKIFLKFSTRFHLIHRKTGGKQKNNDNINSTINAGSIRNAKRGKFNDSRKKE